MSTRTRLRASPAGQPRAAVPTWPGIEFVNFPLRETAFICYKQFTESSVASRMILQLSSPSGI